MPQLEVSTYLTQIFWLVVTFMTFWFIMAKYIIPQIAQTVEARKRKYNDFIKKAEEVNKKALASIKRYDETIAAAKKDAAEQINRNKQELKEFVTQKQEEVNLQLKQKIAENEMMLQQERDKTMEQIEVLSQDMVMEILKKLEITSITQENIEKSIKESNL